MAGYASRAACRGRRPSSFASFNGNQRPAISSLLLKERRVARFLTAPNGYGKTASAIEYAETMFSWVHVFWFNAQSPCFIRDLDAHDLAQSCLRVDPNAALVVFDDVPALNFERMECFSREIDTLLDEGCEVVVTCVPSSRMISVMQFDRIEVGAVDLLLSDAELDRSRTADERARVPAEYVSDVQRIPGLVWSSAEGNQISFVKGLLAEELPSDLLLIMLSALVLRTATLDDLKAVLAFDDDLLDEIADDYPHLGFSPQGGYFETALVEVPALISALKPHAARLVERSRFDSLDQLAYAWADMLLAHGQAARACDVVREACPRTRRTPWMVENAYHLIRRACFFPLIKLAEGRAGGKAPELMRAMAIEAFCRRVLGDEDGAVQCGKRYAFDEEAPFDVRVLSLLVVARVGSGPLAQRANECLGDASLLENENRGDYGALWMALVEAWTACSQGPVELAQVWSAFRERGMDDDVLCVCASWLFGLLDPASGQESYLDAVFQHPAELFVRSLLESTDTGVIDYFSASAGLSMEAAHQRGVSYTEGPLHASVLFGLRQIEVGILAQRRAFAEDMRAQRLRKSDWAVTHPDMLLSPSAFRIEQRKSSVPVLTVRLFGRFEVLIGDTVIEQNRFCRENTRSLLVMLAMSQGKDVSRDSLASAMWPDSPSDIARKNFYTIWSQLRRALTLSDGTCPYLLRHQFGCSLEMRYVQCDVARLDEICRELMFGVPNLEHWSIIFSEIDRDFSGELMPAERKNPFIAKVRDEYRMRLVDALVAATITAIDIDNPQWGIWFARAALSHDDLREDAYVALMRAQIAFNQRTAAMQTYLRCREVLAERLGIDPSPETVRLYEEMLA